MSYSIDPTAKLKIISLEGPNVTVEAMFNPKEVAVEKTVPWGAQQKKGAADLEYTGGAPMTMSFELMFDAYESGETILPKIQALYKLTDASITDEIIGSKKNEQGKRPPKCKVIWGAQAESHDGGVPKFECVIESVSVKYTMFSPDGIALRATVNIKVKEAKDLGVGRKK